MDKIDVEWTVPGLLWTVAQRNDGNTEIKINSEMVSPQINFPADICLFLPLHISSLIFILPSSSFRSLQNFVSSHL